MAGSASRSATGEFTITTSACVDDALRDRVLAGLDAALPDDVPASGRTPLAVLLRAAQGQLVGALTGRTLWGWLVIDLLWVDSSARGEGHGRRLVAAAEQEAMRRGCQHARVDTYSFQAPGFYERCGYARLATLDDFPRGHQRHFYAKTLA